MTDSTHPLQQQVKRVGLAAGPPAALLLYRLLPTECHVAADDWRSVDVALGEVAVPETGAAHPIL